MMYKDAGIVVEGGGMRGAYTGGILDVFNENGIKFGGAVGTSAGVTHLCSYLSEQVGRNFRIDTIHSKSKKYMSWGNLIRTGEFFEVDYCYRQIPYEIDPFDMEKFACGGLQRNRVLRLQFQPGNRQCGIPAGHGLPHRARQGCHSCIGVAPANEPHRECGRQETFGRRH